MKQAVLCLHACTHPWYNTAARVTHITTSFESTRHEHARHAMHCQELYEIFITAAIPVVTLYRRACLHVHSNTC